jgi:hypothetical protein
MRRTLLSLTLALAPASVFAQPGQPTAVSPVGAIATNQPTYTCAERTD